MASNIAAGKWKQFRGEMKKQWGKLTDDEIDQVEGNREMLVGKIQERYGKDKQIAEREVNEFFERSAQQGNAPQRRA